MITSVCPKCGQTIRYVVVDELCEVWVRKKVEYQPGKKLDLSRYTANLLGEPKKVLQVDYCCANCGANMGENFIMEDIL